MSPAPTTSANENPQPQHDPGTLGHPVLSPCPHPAPGAATVLAGPGPTPMPPSPGPAPTSSGALGQPSPPVSGFCVLLSPSFPPLCLLPFPPLLVSPSSLPSSSSPSSDSDHSVLWWMASRASEPPWSHWGWMTVGRWPVFSGWGSHRSSDLPPNKSMASASLRLKPWASGISVLKRLQSASPEVTKPSQGG